MYFSISFEAEKETKLSVPNFLGLEDVDRIRSIIGSNIELCDIDPSVFGLTKSKIQDLKITEKQARSVAQHGHFLDRSRIYVKVSGGIPEKYFVPVFKKDENLHKRYYKTYQLDEERFLKDWINAKCPLKWELFA